MEKDHKPREEGKPWPPSRPVCGASITANSRAEDMVTRFVEALADGVEGSRECKSGEDMLAVMEEANEELRKEAMTAVKEALDTAKYLVGVILAGAGLGDRADTVAEGEAERTSKDIVDSILESVMSSRNYSMTETVMITMMKVGPHHG